MSYSQRLAEAELVPSVGSVGHIPPVEAEANYYAAKENLDMAT